MSDLVLKANLRDLGGFAVNRAIPQAKRRQIGPFVFLDHMGPMKVDATHLLNVRPHPHIGLSTVTYLFSGQGYHRDSIGSSQVISPGDLNWMTAGRGIVHSERTPEEVLRSTDPGEIHGIQIWVGLPVSHEECEPSFTHYPAKTFPLIQTEGLAGKLLVGECQGQTSSVKTYSRTFFADLESQKGCREVLSFSEKEIGIFLISGELEVNDISLAPNDLVVVADPRSIAVAYGEQTHFIVIGGEPFPEPRYIWWNFVSSTKERIRRAAQDWREQNFPKVAGDEEVIPLPDIPLP